jgi:hypothetical protein
VTKRSKSKPASVALTRVGVSTPALWAVVRNAIRHLTEADVHYKNSRYPSALASAVLSIEEAGKAITCMAHGKDIESGNRHVIHQMPFVAVVTVLMKLQTVAKWQSILKNGLAPDADVPIEVQQIVDKHPEFASFITDLRAGRLSGQQQRLEAWARARVAEETRNGTLDEWQKPILGGVLHELRLKSIYVDIGKDGEVVSAPNAIDEDTAKSVCVSALAFIMFIATEPRLAAHRDETGELLEGMTGTETVAYWFRAFFIGPSDSSPVAANATTDPC